MCSENTCAHFLVRGVRCVPPGVAHLGGINSFLSPELPLCSPETAHALIKHKQIKKADSGHITDQSSGDILLLPRDVSFVTYQTSPSVSRLETVERFCFHSRRVSLHQERKRKC